MADLPSVADIEKTASYMGDIDTFVSSPYETFVDSDGNTRKTLEGIISGAPSGSKSGTVQVSDYYEAGDEYLEQAWNRMVVDIEDETSSNYGKRNITIGKNPKLNSNGVWDQFEPVQIPSNVTVDFEFVQINWVNSDTNAVYRRTRGMFEAIGGTDYIATTVASDIAEGSDTITVSDTTDFTVGGYAFLSIYNNQDQLTGQYPILYGMGKVLEINGNDIRLDFKVQWDVTLSQQDSATLLPFDKDDVPQNITVKNFYTDDNQMYEVRSTPPDTGDAIQPDYVIGQFLFSFCDDVHVETVIGKNYICPLVMFREYGSNCSAKNVQGYTPRALGAGEGYVIQWTRGNQSDSYNIIGYETRHVHDITGGDNHRAVRLRDYTSTELSTPRVSFLLHGRYESNIYYEDLVGSKHGFGAGFTGGGDGFGNWIKNVKMTEFDLAYIEGRGVIGEWCLSGKVREMENSVYAEKVVLDNFDVVVGDPTPWARETRLSSPIDQNGLYVTGASKLRLGSVTGFDNFIVDGSCRLATGGSTRNLITITDVKKTVIDGVCDNQAFKITGGSEYFEAKPSLSAVFPNALGNDGFVSASSITSSELTVRLSGSWQSSYTGGSTHRPMKFQIGSGSTYTIHLTMENLELTGNWNGGGQVLNDLTLKGYMNKCRFDNLSPPNFVNGSFVRKPWPSTFKAEGNRYTDESRNYDNVNRMFKKRVDFGNIASGAESGVVVWSQGDGGDLGWLDLDQDAYINVGIDGSTYGVPQDIQWLSFINKQASPSILAARCRNFKATTQGIALEMVFTYSIV